MKKITTPRHTILLCLLLFLFCAPSVFSQLNNFSLNITKSDETCTGNGTIQFSTSGTTAGASVFYSVYLLPDVVTPIAVINTETLSGLSAGNYLIVALQTLENFSNSQQQEVQILDNRTPLLYQCVAQGVNCLSGKITVEVAQGNPLTYEIISGPTTVLPQTSNIFNDLPLGQYVVKVTDVCGDAVVQACTVVYVFAPENLIIPNRGLQQCELVDCNTIAVEYTLRAERDTEIAYPFNVEFTVFPPDGSTPLIFNQYVTTGDPDVLELFFNIPFYANPNYVTNIKITDPCGNVTEKNGITIRRLPNFALSPQPQSQCLKEINIHACNVLLPLTVSFLDAPAGFNPTSFNSGGLGPYYTTDISYLSDAQNELPDGNYTIKVTDACGKILQDTIEVKYSVTKGRVIEENRYYEDCVLYFPINIPDGNVPPVTVIITDAPPGFSLTHPLPYNYSFAIENGEFYEPFSVPGDYTFTGVNDCGLTYEFVLNIPEVTVETELYASNGYGCTNTGRIRIRNENAPPTSIISITQAPSSLGVPLPYDVLYEGLFNDVFMEGLPPGDFTFTITDVCGNTYGPFTQNIPSSLYPGLPSVSVLEGCDFGYGSLKLDLPLEANTSLETVIIMAAPPTYLQTLPYNVSFNIDGLFGAFYMNSLPEGTYTFYTKDRCGVEHTFDVTIGNHFFDTTAKVEGNCGSFNLFLDNVGGIPEAPVYLVLQKLNPATNLWGHPITGAPFFSGNFPNAINSYLLTENNYNIVSQGTFRIMKVNYIYSNGIPPMIACLQTLKEFDFFWSLKINNAFKISCSNGNSQVLLVAGDTQPLTYKIIEKNGQPFLVDNQSSNVFNGLVPGIYKFQVEDICGNIVTRLFDLTALAEPVVTSSSLCDGQAATLNVQPFSFLSYQWWNANDPNTILSTTSTLHFAPFSIVNSPGTYYVRVYSETTLSCVDITIPYVIPNAIDPKAGNDNAITLCATSAFDLNTMLNGIHDTNGIWTETTDTGMLSGHYWLPIGLAPDTYEFKYTVNGFCGILDEAEFTITLNNLLPIPIIHTASSFCVDDSISFDVDAILGATYEWTGPNGFSANIQNPIIENATTSNSGTYILNALANGCASSSSVSLMVNPNPEFEFNIGCNNNNRVLSVVPNANSFNPDLVNYSWIGPEGYTSNEPTVVLNNLNPGQFSVTITNIEGCSKTKSTTVQNTKCAIPLGISPNGDAYNQSFDLTGFDVLYLEIFSRYGNVVYEQNNYTNQWHGQDYNDHQLPDATYFYYIQLKSGEEKTGWVYVTR